MEANSDLGAAAAPPEPAGGGSQINRKRVKRRMRDVIGVISEELWHLDTFMNPRAGYFYEPIHLLKDLPHDFVQKYYKCLTDNGKEGMALKVVDWMIANDKFDSVDDFRDCVLSIFVNARLVFEQKITLDPNVVKSADYLEDLFVKAMDLLNSDRFKPLVGGQLSSEHFDIRKGELKDTVKGLFAQESSLSLPSETDGQNSSRKKGKQKGKSQRLTGTKSKSSITPASTNNDDAGPADSTIVSAGSDSEEVVRLESIVSVASTPAGGPPPGQPTHAEVDATADPERPSSVIRNTPVVGVTVSTHVQFQSDFKVSKRKRGNMSEAAQSSISTPGPGPEPASAQEQAASKRQKTEQFSTSNEWMCKHNPVCHFKGTNADVVEHEKVCHVVGSVHAPTMLPSDDANFDSETTVKAQLELTESPELVILGFDNPNGLVRVGPRGGPVQQLIAVPADKVGAMFVGDKWPTPGVGVDNELGSQPPGSPNGPPIDAPTDSELADAPARTHNDGVNIDGGGGGGGGDSFEDEEDAADLAATATVGSTPAYQAAQATSQAAQATFQAAQAAAQQADQATQIVAQQEEHAVQATADMNAEFEAAIQAILADSDSEEDRY
jgi:hypothetical protein